MKYAMSQAADVHQFISHCPKSLTGECGGHLLHECAPWPSSATLAGPALTQWPFPQHLRQWKDLEIGELWVSHLLCLLSSGVHLWGAEPLWEVTFAQARCSAIISLPLLSCLPRGIIQDSKYKLCHLKIHTLFCQGFYFSPRWHYPSF